MKKALLILFALSCSNFLYTQCAVGSLNLLSQDDVNTYATNLGTCTVLDGTLYISGADITDLSGLQNLTGISGNLIIENNGQLSNLDGLQNLAIVDGLFYIDNNDLLTSLDELYSLVYIGGDFALRYNDLLANIDGLQNLTNVEGNLFIENNPQLTEFCGLYTVFTENEISTPVFFENGRMTSVTEVINGGACIRILPPLPQDLPLMPSWQLFWLGLSVLSIGGLSYRKLF